MSVDRLSSRDSVSAGGEPTESPVNEPQPLVRALAWALYWIARHGIVPTAGEDPDEWERWAEARRLVKAAEAPR